MKHITKKLVATILFIAFSLTYSHAQFPGCPDIDAGLDQTLPCTTPCTNLTATPFHTGATTTYTVGSIPHAPPIAYNAAGGTAVSVNTDDVWSPIVNLPFNFCYYGVNYNTVNIGSNGSIQFGPVVGGGFAPWSFTASCPSAALSPAGDVFGVYHDTDPSIGGTIKWYLLGSAPCRIFVVSFNNLPHYTAACNGLTSRSMIVLYETTNAIDVYVQNKPTCGTWNNGNAVIGIQNPAGTAGLAAPGRNTGSWSVTTPEAWRFTPNGVPNYSIAWFQGATQIGTGPTINVCPGGTTTYTAQITYTRCDATTVVETDQVTISYNPLTPPTVTPVNESCSNYNNGSVTINNPVGAGPYTVTIAGPANASVVEPNTAAAFANFTNLPDGNYTYTVTGANGCTTNGVFTIAPGPPCCSVTANGTNILCNGASTGTVTATPVGLSPFSYSWTGGQTTQTATSLAAGSYTVTMTDFSGCVSTATVAITAPVAVSGSTTFTNISCNGVCNGTITVTAAGGVGPYQYSLNGGPYQAGNVFSGLCAGAYSITIKDANNCTVVVNRTITQPPLLTLVTGTIVPATCGANNGSVTVTAGGGTPVYNYSIGGPNQVSPTFTGLAPGSYTVTVTDANGCTRTVPVTIAAISTPIASIISQVNVSCFGGSNGSVLIGATGGIAPITYSLNGGPFQASNSFTSLTAGNYTATIKDVNNCTATINFTITSPTQLSFTSVPTAVLCNGQCNGQIQVNAVGGTLPYQFSSNGGATYGIANPLTGLCAGTTSVVVQDANGCLVNANVNISQPAVLTATFTNTNPICNGICNGQVVVAASGGTAAYQYSFNGGALQASPTLTGLCGAANTILVQDNNGCQFTSVQTLIDPPGYGIDPVTIVESNCGFNNGSITVAANGLNGPFSYSLELGPYQPSGLFSNLFGGAYSITAIDQLGCVEQVFLGINDVEMDGIVLVETDALCFGSADGTIEVTNVSGAAPITYELDNSGATQTNGTFLGLLEGSHVVTIYDGGLCVFTLPFIIDQPPLINFSATVTGVLCNGGSTGQIVFNSMAGGTGAYQYSINNGTSYQASGTFTGLAAGTYNLAVMDANSCVVYGTATVNQAPPLAFTSSTFDLTCNGNNTGFIQLAATGGTGAYQFSIDNGTTFSAGDSFFGLAAGNYPVVVQDAVGCTVNGALVLTEPAVLSSTYTPTPALCNGVCDGQLAFAASGGTAPYQYSVTNGATFGVSPTITGLCANTYTVVVKDFNNCTISSTQVITEPAGVTVNAIPTASTCSLPNGSIVINAAGGLPTYNYSIDGGLTFTTVNTFNGLLAGSYSIQVTDLNNCPKNAVTVIVDQAAPIITGVYLTDATCATFCDGEVAVTTTGGTGALSYSIGGAPQAGTTITGVCAGNYTLTVTDQNTCTDTQPIVIAEPLPLTYTTVITDLTCFNDNSGEIAFTAAGGTPIYNYSVDNGATFFTQNSIAFLSAGTYDLIVTDQNNCSTPAQVVVNEPAELLIQNQTSNNVTCYAACDGDATVTFIGGTGGYNYTWTNGIVGTNSVTNLCSGSYDVTGTDANGCTIVASYTITEPPMLSIVSTSATAALCNGSCDGTITINSPLAVDYSVDGGLTFQASNAFNGLCAGNYTIVVRDAAGCTQSQVIVINEPLPLVQNLIPEDGITICYDGYGTLSASATGGTAPYYYVWNTLDTVQYLNVNLTLPATFTCTVYDQNGCVSNAVTADVLIRPPFVASVTSPVSACPGQPVSATASGIDGLLNYSYEWLSTTLDTLGNGSTYGYVPATSETILMVAHDACFRYDTLEVEVIVFTPPAPNFTVNPASGCSPLDATFTNLVNATTVASAIWQFGDGTTFNGNTNVTHQYTAVGCYDVTLEVTSIDGCISDTILPNVVCVVPDPIADFSFSPTAPTTVNSNVNFTDQSTNAISYSWSFGQFGSSSLENPTINYGNILPGEQLACLEVTSPQGCVDSVCKTILFVEEFTLFIPNTFTPDEDEFNPEFKPVLPDGLIIDDYTFYIYNRWGEVLFESHNYEIGWDGTYHNEVVKEGTYTWTIQLVGGPTQTRYRYDGHVNLLR